MSLSFETNNIFNQINEENFPFHGYSIKPAFDQLVKDLSTNQIAIVERMKTEGVFEGEAGKALKHQVRSSLFLDVPVEERVLSILGGVSCQRYPKGWQELYQAFSIKATYDEENQIVAALKGENELKFFIGNTSLNAPMDSFGVIGGILMIMPEKAFKKVKENGLITGVHLKSERLANFDYLEIIYIAITGKVLKETGGDSGIKFVEVDDQVLYILDPKWPKARQLIQGNDLLNRIEPVVVQTEPTSPVSIRVVNGNIVK